MIKTKTEIIKEDFWTPAEYVISLIFLMMLPFCLLISFGRIELAIGYIIVVLIHI